ncbi:MAG: 50S ribosomal protein L35 [Coxiella endosymbiont of Dermacentor nuttalli]
MPKLKTNRGVTKRFKKTGQDAIKQAAANHNHILTKKSQKRKRRLRKLHPIAKSDIRVIKKMLRV